jgi:hypothetical protein
MWAIRTSQEGLLHRVTKLEERNDQTQSCDEIRTLIGLGDVVQADEKISAAELGQFLDHTDSLGALDTLEKMIHDRRVEILSARFDFPKNYWSIRSLLPNFFSVGRHQEHSGSEGDEWQMSRMRHMHVRDWDVFCEEHHARINARGENRA